MGFLSSSCSFTRFRVADDIPEDFWSSVPDRLKRFAFHDIDAVPEIRSFGWVAFDDMLDTEWQSASPYKGAYLVFSLRLDTRRIPAGVIKKHLSLAMKKERELIAEQNKEFISRERRKELKEQVMLMLRQRFLPVPAECNVVWNREKNEIWLASIQASMIELFIDCFQNTFELTLEQLTPFSIAANTLDEAAMTELERLEETQFIVP